jgi:hypothetical protein
MPLQAAWAGDGMPAPGGNPVPAHGRLGATYRFGRRSLRLETDDPDFERRFFHVFSDCRSEEPDGSPPVRVEVLRERPGWVGVRFPDGAIAPDPAILALLAPELGLAPCSADACAFVRAHDPARSVARVSGDALQLSDTLPWQLLAGHYIVHQLLRSQPELLYLHAAGVVLAGRAVLLCGPKGAGKSTLSLTLAGRGGGFLGDEVAVLELSTGQVLPFHRSVSVRPGPLGAAALQQLDALAPDHETLPDGSVRRRAPLSRLFPRALAAQAPLAAAFFLEPHAARPAAERFAFTTEQLARMEPLQASFTGAPAGRRALQLLRLLSPLPCYRLVPGGTPDDTAATIERTLEAVWA